MKTALLVLLVSATAAAEPAKLDVLVGKLAGQACAPLSQLEAILGPQHHAPKDDAEAMLDFELTVANGKQLGIRRAFATPSIDIYHQEPSSVKDPTIGELVLDLDEHVDIAALFAKRPEGARYPVGTDTVFHAGALFGSTAAHRISLVCGKRRPTWAQRPWTSEAARDAVQHIVAAIEGKSMSSITDERYELTAVGGVEVMFATPLPAAPLLQQLGATKVVLRAVDAHMSHWVLRHADAKQTPIVYAGKTIAITVDDSALEFADRRKPLDITTLRMTSLEAQIR